MIVYCNAEDCKHNVDGQCYCKWPIGMEAIGLRETTYGIMCEDYRERNDRRVENDG